MDTEKGEAVEVPEPQNQEEIVTEQEEKPEAKAEPENPPAAVEEPDQLAVNGHAAEVADAQETKEPALVENVTQEIKEAAVEGGMEKPEEESVASPAESVESSEKVSDPAEALDTKPESTEQQAVPENIPEPVQAHLAESTPEPEPEKPAEAVPQQETIPEPAVEKPVEPQPSSQEETEPEKAKTENEVPTKVEMTTEKEAVVQTVAVTEASPEKPAEAETIEKEPSGESGEPAAEEKKEVNPDKSETAAPQETAVEAAASVQEEPKPQQDVDPDPAPNSLSFPILEHEETKDALRISRTLIVLRGLPGSGKSFLARAIAETYKDQCCVFCADDHGIKPESPSTEGYKALDDAVVARCGEGTTSPVVVVVDDTNHTQDRVARLGEIAEEHRLVIIFLEPKTEWSRDTSLLKKKTGRGLEETHLKGMKGPLEETTLPLYFGWFLFSSVQDKVGCTAMDFLKTLDTLEAFKKHIEDFAGQAGKEIDLEQYFEVKQTLHCTTKFCNYGKADGAAEYAENPVVRKSYGSVFELSLTALFVTPRTVGARVSLSEEQLKLWPADTEKEAEASVPGSASMPVGSRAHITLGCAEGVEPVQTGLDLLQMLALPQGEVVEEMELGSLRYYGEGRWMLSLREPICAAACFSSFYGRNEMEPPKKEPEKKKKVKCAIL